MSVVGQAFVEVLPLSTGFAPALDRQLKTSMAQATATTDTAFAGISRKVTLGVAAVAVAAVGASVKAATSFDTLTTSLVTGAGESEKNLDKVRQGILNLAPAMGTSSIQLTNGLYMIESAGFHGAAGLDVLKASAEGAKVGNADLATVANAVTTALIDYHLPASQAASVTSMLVETVASGKTHMQDLAGALSEVLPVAAAAHVNLGQVTGALATMTGQGISAQQAAQNVANTIRSLQDPSHVAISVLNQFGVNVTDLTQNLGQRGLTGSLDVLVNAIGQHMGPSGMVLINTFKQSQSAAADAKVELAAMPASLKAIANGYLSGTVTQSQWRKELKGLTADQRQMATEFKGTVDQTRGFSDALKSGTPQAQTMGQVLSQMLGGATGLNTALALTGPNMVTFTNNVANIDAAGKSGATTVQGFALVQKDFGFQIDQAKAGVGAFAISLGERLIPIVQQGIAVGMVAVHWLTQHHDVAVGLALVIGGALTAVMSAYVVLLVGRFASAIGRAASGIASLAGKLLGLGSAQSTAAAETAAGAEETIGANEMMAASMAELNASVQALVTTLGGELPAALEVVAGAEEETAAVSESTGGGLGPMGIAIGAIVIAATLLATHWRQVWQVIQEVAGVAWKWIDSNVVKPVMSVVGPALQGIVSVVQSVVGGIETAFDAVRAWFVKWWPILLPIVMTLFLGPLGLLIGVVIDEIIKHWHTLVAVTEAVWRFIDSDIIRPILGPLTAWIGLQWGVVVAVATAMWDVLKTYFTLWWDVVAAVFKVALAIIGGVLQEEWLIIRAVLVTAWEGIKTYFEVWWTILAAVFKIAWDIIHGIFTVALDLIEGKWGAAWDAIKTTFSQVWNIIKSTASSLWGEISGFFTGAFSTFTDFWSSTWGNISKTFVNVWNGIAWGAGAIWGTITQAFQSGIRDVENLVNSIFINPINAVLGIFGVKIQPFNTSAGGGGGFAHPSSGAQAAGKAAHMESGGMVVNSPTVLVGEGARGYPEWVIPSDPLYRGRAHALLGSLISTIGVPGLSGGGVWGSITGAASDVGGAISNVASAGWNSVAGAAQWVAAHGVGPAIDAVASSAEAAMPAGWFGRTMSGVIKYMADTMKKWVAGRPTTANLPSADHKGMIDQALALAGQAVNVANEAAVNMIVSHESGWNPSAINLTDSNAQAGHPSQGLMQTIPSTFAAYALQGYNSSIDDPLSNLIAGIRYAVSRYGNLSAVPGVVAVNRGGAYVGYDSGGWLMPGLTMAVNNTGVPERVISPSGAGGGGGISLAAGAVSVSVAVSGDTSSAAGIQQLVEQGVQQGVTEALNEILDRASQQRLVSH